MRYYIANNLNIFDFDRRFEVAESSIEPFCGSGTTGVVCKKLKRSFVGIDNNAEYLNIAKKRLLAINSRMKNEENT